MSTYRKKLIEVSLPLEAINAASAREKSIRHGHPSTLHLWWARRPLAAARAVLFAQFVDDPSSWPEVFPTEEDQNRERQRLFRIIEQLVLWENSNNETVINAARLEIARSHARSSLSAKARAVLADGVSPAVVNDYLATELPPVHDPFAGGGTIPLEAQRLGLRAIATDLNPVAVMINKALIEIPPKFAGLPPVNPESRKNAKLRNWKGAEGLAEDVRYYGAWMRKEAKKRIGHLYPDVELPKEQGGGRGTIIAWLWARTVKCPNPACGAETPLMRSMALSTKKGKETWIAVSVDRRRSPPDIHFGVECAAVGGNRTAPSATLTRAGAKCVACEAPIEVEFIRSEGRARRLRERLTACVVGGSSSRTYLAADRMQVEAARVPSVSQEVLDTELPRQALGFRVQAYGLTRHRDLFTDRQLMMLTTFSELVDEVRNQVKAHASSALPDGYAEAVATYLALSVSRMANYASCLCVWSSHPKDELVKQVFSRQALVMAPDYAETNPFAESSGGWTGVVEYVAKAIPSLRCALPGIVGQLSATKMQSPSVVVSCDPPYYDNIGYADLSDFFYSWLRRALRNVYPELTASILTPKDEELILEPGRFETREDAQRHFEEGLTRAFVTIRSSSVDAVPTTVFYAFKQSESAEDGGDRSGGSGTVSSGWERMLVGLCSSGFTVSGTLPLRTELGSGLRELGRNALASSILLVCEKRAADAPSTSRGDFRRLLRKELPEALKKLQQGNIAPVDVAQASIGPGMAIFSRHKQVSEADGSPMTVRSALQLINEVLDEYLASGEGDFDADTRFAITWYEQHGWSAGPFGDAETLAKARNVSVSGVVEAGICHSGGGKVRILKRPEMRPLDYDPATDDRPTIWEFTQHMIRVLEDEGEEAAARLLKKLGSASDTTRELAYRLYNTCERKKWAEDARAYNGLILAWPELEKLAAKVGDEPEPAPVKGRKKAAKKAAKATAKKGQISMFEESDDE